MMGQYGGEGLEEGENGEQYVQVTEEEKAAIERLEAMGFDKSMVRLLLIDLKVPY